MVTRLHGDSLQIAVIATADCCRRSPASPARATEHGAPWPHYSADYRSGIVPNQPFLSGKPAPYFPANPNKIKGHGNPVPTQFDLLSQRKKPIITDSYITF